MTTDKLLDATDQCVKCGLCLPHCPTYRLSRVEAESPRGRISLVQGLVSGALSPSAQLDAHLASCLECHACALVCPSLVGVASIMDQVYARRNLALTPLRRQLRLGWLKSLGSPRLMRAAQRLGAIYRLTGAARLARRLGLSRLLRINAYVRLAEGLQGPPRWEPRGAAGAEVALFLGCSSEVAQAGALEAAAQVLGRLSIKVVRLGGQGCCGAMLRHNGFPRDANRLLQRNANALGGRVLVGVASACLAELRTHPGLAQAAELCTYLDAVPWPQGLSLARLSADVLVHEPCSHRNQLGGNGAVHRLLARIPGLRVAVLPDNALCCGAAGTYMLQHPDTALALLKLKLAHLDRLRPSFLVTTNPGCALHLAAGLREAGLPIEVCHPAELIARQLPPLGPR